MKTITLYAVRVTDMTGQHIGTTYHTSKRSAEIAESFNKQYGYKAVIGRVKYEHTRRGVCGLLNQRITDTIEIR